MSAVDSPALSKVINPKTLGAQNILHKIDAKCTSKKYENSVNISDDEESNDSYRSQSFIEYDLLINFCGIEMNVISLKRSVKLEQGASIY